MSASSAAQPVSAMSASSAAQPVSAMSASSAAQPGCVLLNVNAFYGQRRNATTASSITRNHEKIEVSLCPAPPPLPSNLYVHCPELRLTVFPRVICAVEDLFLLRVAVDCQPKGYWSPEACDYFVYRAGGSTRRQEQPSLQRLSRPHPFFHDDDVGLLSRGANYTVAVLMFTGTPEYDLDILHSENPTEWIHRKVSVTEPQRRFPVLIPENCGRLLHHETSTVISIGGEAGTMGWVDLWYGILLCDVLSDEPALREVPLPVPLDWVSCDNGQGTELGCPIPFRGIAFIKGGTGDNPDDCLKLVHMSADATYIPDGDNFKMHDWTVITYTNTAMTSSWKDWHRDCWIQASDITINSQLKSELLQSGLLGSSSGEALQNLLVSHPAPDVSAAAHEGVVYLMARKEYEHPELWALAVDTRNKKLLGAAEFGTERQPALPPAVIYFPSGIAKYIKPDTGTNFGGRLPNSKSNA